MNLENAKATIGLTARSEMTAPGASSSERQLIGLPATDVSFSDADIIYAFTVSAAVGAIETLTLASGAVSSSGASTITDAGADFEGAALPTMANLLAVLVEASSGNSGRIAVYGANTLNFPSSSTCGCYPGNRILFLFSGTPDSIATDEMKFQASNPGDSYTVTIIGKSS